MGQEATLLFVELLFAEPYLTLLSESGWMEVRRFPWLEEHWREHLGAFPATESVYRHKGTAWEGVVIPWQCEARLHPHYHPFWHQYVVNRPMVIYARNPVQAFLDTPVEVTVDAVRNYCEWYWNSIERLIQLPSRYLILRHEDGVGANVRRTAEFLEMPRPALQETPAPEQDVAQRVVGSAWLVDRLREFEFRYRHYAETLNRLGERHFFYTTRVRT